MSRALFVLIASVAAYWGGATDVGTRYRPPKCCPLGQGLNSILDCESTNKDELIIPMDILNQYPECPREHIKLNNAEEGTEIMCLDKILGNDNSIRDSSKLIGLTCDNISSYYDDYNKFYVPKVASLKKCCPPDRKYTNYTVGCWSSDVLNDNKTIDKLIESLLNDTPSYIDITYGAPICKSKEVLVDYKIPKYQVRQLDSEAIYMRIPGHRESIIFPPESICVDVYGYDDLTITVRVCQDEILTCKYQNKICIRKCCLDGQSMVYTDSKNCVKSKKKFNPKFYSGTNSRNIKLLNNNDIYPSIAYGQKCADIYLLEPWMYEDDISYLDENGELYLPMLNSYLNKDSYCMEFLSSEKHNISYLVTFACFPEIMDNQSSNLTSSFYIATSAGNIISCFFLFLTLTVYLCLPNLQNIHGKTIMCYTGSLLSACICLSVNQLGSTFDFLQEEYECRAVGYATMFTFLATFSWLNVLCFDIWYTFGSVRSSFVKRKNKTKSCRFFIYNIYCWGFAAVITISIVATDYAAKHGLVTHFWVSDIGVNRCWFSYNTKGKTIFFIIPVGTQMIINFILFILTTRHCLRIKNAVSKMDNSSTAKMRYITDKKKFIMAIKLFIVMGITWFAEILSQFIDPPSNWWLPSDIANCMQGIMIFFLFVIKRTVLKGIANRINQILSCCSINKTSHKTRSGSSSIFTTTSSECKLSSVRQK